MKFQIDVDGVPRQVEVSGGTVTVDGEVVEGTVARVGETDCYSVLLDGRSYSLQAVRNGPGQWLVENGGNHHSVRVVDEARARALALTGGAGGRARARTLKAPMPGLVVKVEVDVGEAVEEGQGLVIVEAMKMENELTAAAAGVVARVAVQAGDAVEKDQVLMEFEQDPDQ